MFQDICCIVQGLSVTDIADIACIAHNIPTLRFLPPYIKRRTEHKKTSTKEIFVPSQSSRMDFGNERVYHDLEYSKLGEFVKVRVATFYFHVPFSWKTSSFAFLVGPSLLICLLESTRKIEVSFGIKTKRK